MNSTFVFIGLLSFLLFLFLFIKIFSKYENKSTMKVMKSFLTIGVSYLILSLLSFLWFFNYLEFSSSEFCLLYSVVIFIQSVVFFKVTYMFSKNKNLNYLLGMYIITILILFLSMGFVLDLFLVVSFLFNLLIFIDFSLRDDEYRRVGYLGILYSVISLVISLLVLLEIIELYNYSIISLLLLIYLFKVFVDDLKEYSVLPFRAAEKKSYFMSLMGHLIFIITITNFIFIGTIGIHEFGHFGASEFYGCSESEIVYDGSFFHTKILCADGSSTNMIALAGITLPILVAILLIMVGGRFMNEIGFLIIGFNLLSISRDFSVMNISETFMYVSLFVGVIFLVYGMFILAKSKTEEEIYYNT